MEKQKSFTSTKSQALSATSGLSSPNPNAKNMSVAVRIRPLSTKEINAGITSCCQSIGGGIVTIKKSGDSQAHLKSQVAESVNDFAFDNVFTPESSQVEVYDTVIKPIMERFLVGENGTVFAYGATGAGKSHTMLGQKFADQTLFANTAEENNIGMIQRALDDVMAEVETRRGRAQLGEAISLSLSFCEIYNDYVIDLLTTPTGTATLRHQVSGRSLALREDADRGTVEIAGLSEHPVHTAAEAASLIAQGQSLRRTDATMANAVSSRSHAVIQLQLRHVSRTVDGRERALDSRFVLVDLAGSERAAATNNRGTRLQEGANINKSLLALGNCISALSEGKHVKYRDSKLTLLLKPSLEGTGNLAMIAAINPALTSYEDSLHTLVYASRAKHIKVSPQVRERLLESTSLEREQRLREENAALRLRVQQLEDERTRLMQSEDDLRQQLTDKDFKDRRRSRMSFGLAGRASRDRASYGVAGAGDRKSVATQHDENDFLEGANTPDSASQDGNDENKDEAVPSALEEVPSKKPAPKRSMFGWMTCGGANDVK